MESALQCVDSVVTGLRDFWSAMRMTEWTQEVEQRREQLPTTAWMRLERPINYCTVVGQKRGRKFFTSQPLL